MLTTLIKALECAKKGKTQVDFSFLEDDTWDFSLPPVKVKDLYLALKGSGKYDRCTFLIESTGKEIRLRAIASPEFIKTIPYKGLRFSCTMEKLKPFRKLIAKFYKVDPDDSITFFGVVDNELHFQRGTTGKWTLKLINR